MQTVFPAAPDGRQSGAPSGLQSGGSGGRRYLLPGLLPVGPPGHGSRAVLWRGELAGYGVIPTLWVSGQIDKVIDKLSVYVNCVLSRHTYMYSYIIRFTNQFHQPV